MTRRDEEPSRPRSAAAPTGRIQPGETDYRRALLALFAVGLATFAMVYVVQPLLALVSIDVGIDATTASLLLSVPTLAIAVSVIPMARVSEVVGYARIMMLGLSVAVGAGVLAGIAPSFALLLGARALQGVALAAVPTAALAWIAANVEARSVVRVGGLYIAGTTVGGMGGRVLGGIVADLTDWRAAMVVVAVAAGALTVAAHLLLPRRTAVPAARTAGAEPDTLAEDDSRAHRGTRLRLYLVGGLGMAMFVGTFNAIGYRTAAPPFLLGAGLGSMFYLSYLAGTATSSIAGRLEGRVGLRRVELIGVATCVVGVLVTLPDSLALIWLGLAILAAGFFILHAVSSATSARLSRRPSDGSGRYTFAYYLGSSIGGVALGHAWEVAAWGGIAVTALVGFGLTAVVALGLPRRPTWVLRPV